MKFEIKSRESAEIIFSIEADSLRLAIEAAVRSRANLYGADLSGADLSGANLSRADLSGADLSRANLYGANLSRANLYGANLYGADLSRADLSRANLSGANLYGADLSGANLSRADLSGADLSRANLSRANLYGADLSRADISRANLYGADLSRADLSGANLSRADLSRANLSGAKNTVKIMGVEPGNTYWKRFDAGLNNNGYQYRVGLNTLRDGEVFASDDRISCSCPGFHFASRSWCAAYYWQRPLEARVRIPDDAQVNEPWGTDGKASADKIEILQVFEVATGKDVTDQYR